MTEANCIPLSTQAISADGHLRVPLQQNQCNTVESRTSGPTVSFHGLTYTSKRKKKALLRNVSGIFKPGMNVILGPKSSGKSLLLDILAGRKEFQDLSGHILIDGAKKPTDFKLKSGFVDKEDIVMGTLTVKENLEFAASLKLSKCIDKDAQQERVEEVIKELGLQHCADIKVGTELRHGVSSGEKKRTCIAMAIINHAPLLFLKEPTTGLDNSSATSVMVILSKLASKGQTIVLTLHQPRYNIFQKIDRLLLLSQGQVIYHGFATQALEFFKSISYECEIYNNPPDYFLDVINGDIIPKPHLPNHTFTCHSPTDLKPKKSIDFTQLPTGSMAKLEDIESSKDIPDVMTLFSKSVYWSRLHDEIDPILKTFKSRLESGLQERPLPTVYLTSFQTQIHVICARAIKNVTRSPVSSVVQVVGMTLFGLTVGSIYWQIDSNIKSGIHNRMGAFFLILLAISLSSTTTVELFFRERLIFVHESASGLYRVSVYFLAKFFSDLFPIRLPTVIIFSSITYWMIGFRRDFICFLIYTLNMVLTAIVTSSLGYALGATLGTISYTYLILAFSYLLMFMFSSFLINLDSMVKWLRWLKYFNIIQFSLQTLCVTEFQGQSFCTHAHNSSALCLTGETFLQWQDIPYETKWDLWNLQVALIIITALLLIVAYVQLRRMKL